MELSSQLRESEAWPDGNPPERALIAQFAALGPEELAAMLKRMLDEAIDELPMAPSMRASLYALSSGVGELPDELDFVGGDSLLEALGAVQSSNRLHRVALKSLSHALAAAQAAVSAIVEYREYQRDPQAWKQRREVFESGDLIRRHNAATPEYLRVLAEDCREAWLRLLDRAVTGG